MKFCVVLCNFINPINNIEARLLVLVQFTSILCMYSMCVNDLLFMIIITRSISDVTTPNIEY